MTLRRLAPLLALALTLVLAGCTGDDAPAAGNDGAGDGTDGLGAPAGGTGGGATTPAPAGASPTPGTPTTPPIPEGPPVAVDSLSVDNGIVAPGEVVRVTVGLVATSGGSGSVTILLDGVDAGTEPFSLAPSARGNVTFRLASDEPGTHRVEARAEGATIHVSGVSFEVVPAGSLALSNLRTNPPYVDLGDVATVSVDVQNLGSTTTSGSVVAFVGGKEMARKPVQQLAPGESVRVDLTVAPEEGGALPLRVGVTSGSATVEGTLHVRVPQVTNATGTLRPGVCTNYVSYVAEFDNAGDGPARDVVVTGILYLPDGTEHSRHSAAPVDVHPGTRASVEVVPTVAQRCGQDDTYRLVVTIQPKWGEGVTIEHGTFSV